MSMPASPSTPNSAGDDRNLVALDANTALTFEDKMSLFWRKNRGVVLGLCGLVLLAIIGKGAWDYLARQKELDVEKAYSAATSSEQLKAFAVVHPDHALGGIAQLRLADEAYAAGKTADAMTGYEKAAGALKNGPLGARAVLGRALTKAQSGKTAEATSELKQLAGDVNQPKAVRAEAAYHLTSLAVEAGNAADAQTFVDQLTQLDPMGPWAQRAMMLRATLPATPVAAPAAGEGAKKEDAPPAVQLKLPGAK
jgi:hypothetical protein